MPTLHDCLKQLPAGMLMKDTIRDHIKPVSEWLNMKDENGFELSMARSNYGRDKIATIYVPGTGTYLHEIKETEEQRIQRLIDKHKDQLAELE